MSDDDDEKWTPAWGVVVTDGEQGDLQDNERGGNYRRQKSTPSERPAGHIGDGLPLNENTRRQPYYDSFE